MKLIQPLPKRRLVWSAVLFVVGLTGSMLLVKEADRRNEQRAKVYQQSQKNASNLDVRVQ